MIFSIAEKANGNRKMKGLRGKSRTYLNKIETPTVPVELRMIYSIKETR
jgi:hypothetical protein